MRKRLSKISGMIFAVIVALTSVLAVFPKDVKAWNQMEALVLTVSVDGGESVKVEAYQASYRNNIFVSMRGLAKALKGTEKQFNFFWDKYGYEIVTGVPYEEPATEPETTGAAEGGGSNGAEGSSGAEAETTEPVTRPELTYLDIGDYELYVDDRYVVYYFYIVSELEDIYMSLADIQMMFDMTAELSGSKMAVYTDESFGADLEALKADGYFDFANAALLGDLTTGEILFESRGDQKYAIASISKLMTALIVYRYIELGKTSMDDVVVISEESQAVSDSDGCTIYMSAGIRVTVSDLLNLLLVSSSNEAAVALACHIAGTQAEFVRMMNSMAAILNMPTASFVNANGLPVYTESTIPSRQENSMSAEDLFKLCRCIMTKYPEITEITSQKYSVVQSIEIQLSNTNSLLRNMTDVVGLKTGTTDEAGYCLAALRQVEIDGETHYILSVVLGADTAMERVEYSELLMHSDMLPASDDIEEFRKILESP